MPVIRIGKHTLRVSDKDKITDSSSDEEGRSGLTLENAKGLRNRNDRYKHLYEGKRAENIRLARLRQKARKLGVDFRITEDEWDSFLRSEEVEDIRGVEIRVVDREKPMTINNLQVVGKLS